MTFAEIPKDIHGILAGKRYNCSLELYAMHGCRFMMKFADVISPAYSRVPGFRMLVTLVFCWAVQPQLAMSQTPSTGPEVLTPVFSYLLDDNCPDPGKNILVGNQLLRTQADVDALADISKIQGDVFLEPVTNLDLSPLNRLVEITRGLRMDDSTVQLGLVGFNCLSVIGNSLLIYSNPALTQIIGFERLKSVRHFEITNHEALSQIQGFSSLKTITGDLYLSNLRVLQALPDFPSLESIQSYLHLRTLRIITDIPGFNNLTSIGRYLSIRSNLDLEKVTGFAKLTSANVVEPINVSTNIKWDCQQFPPTFVPVDISSNNLVDCLVE